MDASNKNPFLSLIMIVKNEEVFLKQCLESVEDLVDEMVIVDTGSTDRSVEIAESFGARIYHHAWQNSFSEARNYGLQFAKGNWLLQLDGDEELVREDIPLIRQCIQSSEYNGFNVILLNEGPDNALYKHRNIRLFRNGYVYYEGIVHNVPVVQGPVEITPIRILHHGYNLTPEKMEKKFKRSELLLLEQVKQYPQSSYGWANLIRNYRLQKRFNDVVKTGESVLKEINPMPLFQKQMIMNDLMYGYFISDKIDEAISLGEQGLRENPFHLDMIFMMGGCLIKQKKFADAIQFFIQYLKILESGREKEGLEALIIDTYGFQGKAWNNIGTCFRDLGDWKQALIAYQNAISIEDNNGIFYKNIGFIYIQINELQNALEALYRAQKLLPSDVSVTITVEKIKEYLLKENDRSRGNKIRMD